MAISYSNTVKLLPRLLYCLHSQCEYRMNQFHHVLLVNLEISHFRFGSLLSLPIKSRDQPSGLLVSCWLAPIITIMVLRMR